MMLTKISWLPLTLVVMTTLSGPADVQSLQCTTQAYAECAQPFEQFDISNTATSIPSFDVDIMEGICAAHNQSKDCMTELAAVCVGYDAASILGALASNTYVCETTWPAYADHLPCLITAQVQAGGQVCQNTWTSQTNSISSPPNTADNFRAQCVYTNQFVQCRYDLLIDQCGNETAEWLLGNDRVNLADRLDLISCSLMGDMTNQSGPAGVNSLQCTTQQHAACAQPFQQYNIPNTGSSMPSLDVDTMADLCAAHSQSKDCLTELAAVCVGYDAASILGALASNTYICETTWPAYADHQPCFSTAQVQAGGQVCQSTWSSQISSISSPPNTEDNFRAQCVYMNKFVQCRYDLLTDQCGSETAEWLLGNDRVNLADRLDLISCSLTAGISPTASAASLSVLLAAAAVNLFI